MKVSQVVRTGAAVAALTITGVSAAADPGWYAGASFANVHGDFPEMNNGARIGYGPQPHENGFKVLAGLQPYDWLALETNYVDFGTTTGHLGITCVLGGIDDVVAPCPSTFRADASAFSVSALGMVSAGSWDFIARVGVARWRADFDWINSDRTSFDSGNSTGTDLTYGAGIQFRAKSFATRLEYEDFDLGPDSARAFSLGVTYSFR